MVDGLDDITVVFHRCEEGEKIHYSSGFNCEILLIANCVFFHNLQSIELQVKEYAMNMRNHAPSACQALNQASTRSLHLYVQPSRWDWDESSLILQVNSQPTNTQPSIAFTNTKDPCEPLWLAILLFDWLYGYGHSLTTPSNFSYGWGCGLPAWEFAIIRIAIRLVQHHSQSFNYTFKFQPTVIDTNR